MTLTTGRPAVFLDRDGTINEEMGYINHLSRFRLLPEATLSEMVAWVAAGPAANLAAQWIKRHDIDKIRRLHR